MEKRNNKLSFIELNGISQQITENCYNAISSSKAFSIQDFFNLHASSSLVENLQGTQLLGLPALAIFSCQDICSDIFDQVARLFVLASQIPDALVVTGFSKKNAFNNYNKYIKKEEFAHHTWAEINIDGTVWALDFSDQVAMPADLYYQIFKYNPENFVRKTPKEVVYEEKLTECYQVLAGKIQEIAGRTPRLMSEYDILMSKFRRLDEITNMEMYLYNIKNELYQSGLSSSYPSQSHFVRHAKSYESAAKLIKADAPIQDVIKKMFGMYEDARINSEIKPGNAVLAKVFGQTEGMYKYIENLKNSTKQVGSKESDDTQLNLLDLLENN